MRARAGLRIGRSGAGALFDHARDRACRIARHLLSAVVAEVGAHAAVEQQSARERRCPRRLRDALKRVATPGVVRDLRGLRRGGETKRSGGAGCAADDPFIVALLSAAIVVTLPRRALTWILLVPEQVEAMTRCRLQRQPHVCDSPAPSGRRLLREIRDVDELRRVAGILVAIHAGH